MKNHQDPDPSKVQPTTDEEEAEYDVKNEVNPFALGTPKVEGYEVKSANTISEPSENWETIKGWLLDAHAEYQDRNGLDYCKNCGINHEEIVEKIDTLLKAERERAVKEAEYDRISHTHCWNQEKSACNIPLKFHKQCCLCDLKNPYREFSPTPSPTVSEDWKKKLDELWNEHDGTHFYKDEFKEFIKALLKAEREKWEDREMQVMKEMEIMHDFKIKGIQEGRQAQRTELLEEIEGMKSDCKQYHNQWIDTPDKIKGFNFAIECIIKNILKKRV